jgi:hypothetical protein
MQDAITLSDCGSSEHTLIFPYPGNPKNAECSRGLQRESNTRAWAGQTARLRSCGAIVGHHPGHRTVCMPDGRFDRL